MNKRKLTLRLLVSPFIFCLLIVTYNYSAIKRFYYFVKYGGEFLSYENDERKNIDDIYKLLKEKTL